MKKLVVMGFSAIALALISEVSLSCGAGEDTGRRIFWEESGKVKSAPSSSEIRQQLEDKGFLIRDCTRCQDSSEVARMPQDESIMNKADLECLSHDIKRDATKKSF